MQRIKELINKQSLGIALIVIGAIGIIISVVLYVREPKPPSALSAQPHSVSVDQAPSSAKLSAQQVTSYSVPVQDPKYIAIPAIGISNTPVIGLGLLKSGSIATPDNINEAGWYNGSSLPGSLGAMFIYGHVSSWTATGIFYNLKKLASGDKVTITAGDNTIYTYQVVSSKIYPYNAVNMNQVLSPINQSQGGLNLMTCTGQIIKGTSEFNKRLVVFTELIS